MLVEYWFWRYKDPISGHTCKTTVRMTADEAAPYFRAQRIPGTLQFREVEVDFETPLGQLSAARGKKRPVAPRSRQDG